MTRILEAGHYYQVFGPNVHSAQGWSIMQELRETDDATMLFIDDVHAASQAPLEEQQATVLATFDPCPDFTVQESEVAELGMQVLEMLYNIPGKSRRKPRINGVGDVLCSGYRLLSSAGDPSCVLLDLGLCLHKQQLGFSHGLNILPSWYKDQQAAVQQLLDKAGIPFRLEVMLFYPS